jgi:hypothetical protein
MAISKDDCETIATELKEVFKATPRTKGITGAGNVQKVFINTEEEVTSDQLKKMHDLETITLAKFSIKRSGRGVSVAFQNY